MKIFKKFTAITLSLLLIFTLSFQGFAVDEVTTALRFNKDSSFRIMHITDTHLQYSILEKTILLIKEACDKELPDLIALTGDISMCKDKEETLNCIDALMNIFEERKIPVAVIFGNHDNEQGHQTPEELMAIYNSYDCSISVDEGEALSGCGTYNVPILSSTSNEIKYNLWFFDSGSFDDEGHYSSVPADQVKWYKETSEQLENDNGRKIDSLAFQHIIVPEIYDALSMKPYQILYSYEHIYNDGEYYYFNQEMENSGLLHETPCSGFYNYGQFETMVERGDVHGIFSGHDHSNGFSVKYKGINITNTISTRFTEGKSSCQYGYRIIDLDENNTSTYKTHVVHWYDMYDFEDAFTLFIKGDSSSSVAFEIAFYGFFQKYIQLLGAKLTEFFTGRQVYYP